MRLSKHQVSNFRNVLVGAFHGIPCCHQILVVIFPDQFPYLYVLYVFALMLCLRNQHHTPIPMVIFHLNQTTIGHDIGIGDK